MSNLQIHLPRPPPRQPRNHFVICPQSRRRRLASAVLAWAIVVYWFARIICAHSH